MGQNQTALWKDQSISFRVLGGHRGHAQIRSAEEGTLNKGIEGLQSTPSLEGMSRWSGYRDLEGKGPMERPPGEEQCPLSMNPHE